jgi:glycosyltransferase involved in cell wall biosynthesis
MLSKRPLFTLCIPAYNRTRHLPSLLDSIFAQDFEDFEILICEDLSRERPQISEVVGNYVARYPEKIVYSENEQNLGYDRNIRRLVELARGEFCFFMGNDDLLCPGALRHVAGLLAKYPRAGLVLKSYAWFDGSPDQINQEVRYFDAETTFLPGAQSIGICFRRSGVISGYVVNRDAAQACATDRFDGTLYYQMHLTASVLADRCAVATPMVLVLCRNGEPPDFGNSSAEKGKYVPGRYTPQARLHMVGGAMSIVKYLRDSRGVDVVAMVERDYANYFYPYIKDQLDLPLKAYWSLYRSFARMGFGRYPLFHVYFIVAYLLGERRFDGLTRKVREWLGRSPHFGL